MATPKSVYEFTMKDIRGQEKPLESYQGQVLIIANVACECGLTKSNYTELASLVDKYYDQGLRVLLFPCNQFGGQEPGSSDQIREFACQYSPRFDLFEKIKVNGNDAAPLFNYLKKQCPGFLLNRIKWNFTKFLVNRAGSPVARFGPTDSPNSFESKLQELLKESK